MKYINLDQKGGYMAEYIWIDGSNGVRSKTKVRVYFINAMFHYPHRTQASASCTGGSAPDASLLEA